jgi:hypothetical protein
VDGAAERPIVGLLGAFDSGELGEVALRRVVEAELTRRRPDLDLVAYSPFGSDRPVPGDEGRPARALLAVEGGGALGVDALIATGDVLGSDGEWASRYGVSDEVMAARGVAALALSGARAGTPAAAHVVWFAVGAMGDASVDVTALEGRDVWARDGVTQERLGGTAVQSGDPVLLAARVFATDVLRRRADLLRMCGALPAGRRLVVDATRGTGAVAVHAQLVEGLEAALRADPKLSVIVLTLDPIGTPADAALRLGGLLAERVHHFPVWASLDDIAAALSGATGVIATSPAGAHLAAALGSPVVAIDTGLGARFAEGIPVLDGDLQAHVQTLLVKAKPLDIGDDVSTLDAAFAELAARLPSTPGLSPAQPPDPVDSALAVLQQRLVDERTALQAELSRAQAELEHLQASPEHRLARPIREGYQRWQRRRT